MSDEQEKSKWDPMENFVLQMGVSMPEDTVRDDARRISLRYFVEKENLKWGPDSRDLIALVIRDKAEELIKAIYEQMDRVGEQA